MADITATWTWAPRFLSLIGAGPGDEVRLNGAECDMFVRLFHSNSNLISQRLTTASITQITGTVTGGSYSDGTVNWSVVNASADNRVELRINDGITFGTNVTASAKYAALYGVFFGGTSYAEKPLLAVTTFPEVVDVTSGSITMNHNDSDNAGLVFNY